MLKKEELLGIFILVHLIAQTMSNSWATCQVLLSKLQLRSTNISSNISISHSWLNPNTLSTSHSWLNSIVLSINHSWFNSSILPTSHSCFNTNILSTSHSLLKTNKIIFVIKKSQGLLTREGCIFRRYKVKLSILVWIPKDTSHTYIHCFILSLNN